MALQARILCGKCGRLRWIGCFRERDVAELETWRTNATCIECQNKTTRVRRDSLPEGMLRLITKAHRLVHQALQAGKLVVGPCEINTDCRGRLVAHHDDYTKPLDVRWFCRRHHLIHELTHKPCSIKET